MANRDNSTCVDKTRGGIVEIHKGFCEKVDTGERGVVELWIGNIPYDSYGTTWSAWTILDTRSSALWLEDVSWLFLVIRVELNTT